MRTGPMALGHADIIGVQCEPGAAARTYRFYVERWRQHSFQFTLHNNLSLLFMGQAIESNVVGRPLVKDAAIN